MTRSISLDEENKLYGISAIPSVIVFAALASYYGFAHLTKLPSEASIMWDSLWNFIIPTLGTAPTSFFLTYEILTSKKEKSMALHVKRFLGRLAILLINGSLFTLTYLFSYFFLAPLISEKFAVQSSLLIWLLILIISLAKFNDFFDRLEKGSW